jgi:hypothetical protein
MDSENLAPETTEPSAFEILTNVVVAPGDTFEEQRDKPARVSLWLLPILLGCFIGAILGALIVAQPAIAQQLKDMRERQMQKQVESGKITKEAAEQGSKMVEGFMTPTLMTIFAVGGAVVESFARVFVCGLFLWLVASLIYRTQLDFLKWVELSAMSYVVDILGGVVNKLLIIFKGNMLASLSPILFVAEPDSLNRNHLLLGTLELMSIWSLVVLAIGFARYVRKPTWSVCLWMFLAMYGMRVGWIFFSTRS